MYSISCRVAIRVSSEKVVGSAFESVVRLWTGKALEVLENPVRAVIEQRSVITRSSDVFLVREDGSSMEVSYSCAPIMETPARVVGCVFAVRDVSLVRRLEEESSKASKLESLGLLAGGIAHDFNNFLTTIMGNLSYAKRQEETTSEMREILSESEAASKRASELTQQLLTFSKGGAPIKTTASIGEAIRHSIEFSLRGTNTKPRFELSSDLFPVEGRSGSACSTFTE